MNNLFGAWSPKTTLIVVAVIVFWYFFLREGQKASNQKDMLAPKDKAVNYDSFKQGSYTVML